MSNQKCPGTTCITNKLVPQWEDLMRKYSEKHKVTCNFAEMPLSPLHDFPAGSSYDGASDAIGMNGYGEYTFPNGAVYRGQFEDGVFHGNGKIVYNDGPEAKSVICGLWVNGVLTQRKVIFNGTLEYDERDWKYCKLPDRRYDIEYETDLLPAGKSHLTPNVASREIPPGLYDTGDGFYNPKTKTINNYDRELEVIRGPSHRERKWLLENCRKEPLETVGPRPDFYEKWSAPELEPTPPRNPIVWFKKSNDPSLGTQQNEDGVNKPAFYDPGVALQSVPQRKFQNKQN